MRGGSKRGVISLVEGDIGRGIGDRRGCGVVWCGVVRGGVNNIWENKLSRRGGVISLCVLTGGIQYEGKNILK